MVTFESVRALALSFEDTEELPHFEITSFRVKKKIFVTMNSAKQHVTIRLSEVDQSIFCEYNPGVVYRVASAWAKYGWTHVDLQRVEEDLLKHLITLSFCEVAPKKLAERYREQLENEA